MNKSKKPKIFDGIVVSAKMRKTAVVAVSRLIKHPKYGKFIKRTKKFKVHDPDGRAVPGSKARIQETRPISRYKHFQLL